MKLYELSPAPGSVKDCKEKGAATPPATEKRRAVDIKDRRHARAAE